MGSRHRDIEVEAEKLETKFLFLHKGQLTTLYKSLL